jgi:hypothetical protein
MATRFDVSGLISAIRTSGHEVWGLASSGPVGRAARMVAVLTMALVLASCVRVYTADPIKARVVDSITGAPIEGVNVLAAWQAKGGLEGGNIMGYVKVMEDVTNANGEFSFPGWGPKLWMNGAIRNGAPLLILLKPGYEVSLVWEGKYGVEFAPSHLSSSWSGKSLPLKRYPKPDDEYKQSLSGLWTVLDTLLLQDDCAWRSIPRFLFRVNEHRKAFVVAGATLALGDLDQLDGRSGSRCGSLKAFVLEHGR